ncbi:class 3 adenylate cyclase [Pseudacidovorax intermedius]|uniref:Class 3 adenylate cyclase n=1 Tax=Pseudacidovorax intermedius TaxID=433924 RepID=A0A370FRH4_9BURK|nr:adenylate/guanylate cyclase domain-containing protein [Pseudacidovorax intermedius]RDI28949.1 class 3 adenylate cyclase [Pseudacidovorax intermedius]
MTLGRLSDFVRQFARAGEGDSALLSADLRVLARSDRPGRITRLESPADGVLAALREPLARAGAASFTITYRGERYFVQSSVIVATGWRLVSWVPEERVLGGVHRAVGGAMATALGFLGVVLLLSLRLARRVTAPVERLAEFARRIGRLELDGPAPAQSRVLEIQHLAQALDDSARGLRAFRQFVPVQLVRQLMAEGLPLGASGRLRRVTIMFTDIAGFTGLAEGTPAPVLVAQLTDYFNLTAAVIARHGGTIDKYIGDGMMVLWGAPTALPDAELRTCRAALDLQAEVDALNDRARAAGRAPLPTRIGIHTGPVIAGVLGSNDRPAYTAIGDAVNVASRVEELNTALGTRILISEATWQGVAERLPVRRIATETLLRGRQAPLTVYELLEDRAATG